MADVYLDYNHTGTESGTEAEPYNTRGEAVTGAGAGGTIIWKDGVHTPPAHIVFQENRTDVVQNRGQVTIQAGNSEVNYAARTSANLLAANNPYPFKSFIFTSLQPDSLTAIVHMASCMEIVEAV